MHSTKQKRTKQARSTMRIVRVQNDDIAFAVPAQGGIRTLVVDGSSASSKLLSNHTTLKWLRCNNNNNSSSSMVRRWFLFVLSSFGILSVMSSSNNNNNDNNNNNACSNRIQRRGLSPKEIERAAIAARLNELVYNLEQGVTGIFDSSNSSGSNTTAAAGTSLFAELESYGYYNGTYYESGIDAAYTISYNHHTNNNTNDDDDTDQDNHIDAKTYCIVSFRGTAKTQAKDWISNLDATPIEYYSSSSGNTNANNYYNTYQDNNPDDKQESAAASTSTSSSNTTCEIHEGYYLAYNFPYRKEIESFVDDCYKDCSSSSSNSNNNNCDIVLTGYVFYLQWRVCWRMICIVLYQYLTLLCIPSLFFSVQKT